jgi:hypothetical protein
MEDTLFCCATSLLLLLLPLFLLSPSPPYTHINKLLEGRVPEEINS